MLRSIVGLVLVLLTSHLFAVDVKFAGNLSQEIEIEINLNPDEATPTKVKEIGISFTKLPIENEGLLFNDAGLPELPRIHRWIVINPKAQYQVHINSGTYQTYKDTLLYPAQPDNFETRRRHFKMNKLAYLKDRWFGSERVSVGAPAKLGSLTLLPLTFSPATYNPRKRELRVFQTIKITLENTKGNISEPPFEISQFAASQVNLLTLNGNNYLSSFSKIRANKKLLLVHSPILKQTALDLSQLHQSLGTEVTLSEVTPGTSGENIKKLISTQYQSLQMDAVLLLGDESMIPLRSSGGETGDFSYGLLSGNDSVSDVAIGRLPAKNEIQGKIILNKIKTHLELKAKGLTNKKVMLIAHKQEYPEKYTGNMEKVRTRPNPRNLDFTTQYGGEIAQNSTVVEEAQKGYAILNYRGHGSTGSWSSWGHDGASFSTNQVTSLPDNENGLSFIFNVACYNGSIQSSSVSLVERQLFPSDNEKTLQGAIGTFGATAPSMTETNHRFNLNLFEFLQTAEDFSIGNIYTLANNKLTKDNGGSATSNTKMYVLYSDPLISPLIQ